ncbi:bifunctional aldolase/short-chain dehydrogenase [candidate division WOR-3 bacterium]|nr:bifunctional aldolase/short-chain dehydrogenase [candidate division WOR-3 bacterium]
MKNRWSKKEASKFIAKYGKKWGEDLALRTYTSRLIGEAKELVLHGGGNTSVKGVFKNVLGKKFPVIYVKASGQDLSNIELEGHTGIDLDYIRQLQNLKKLSDEDMVNEILTHRFNAKSRTPSIETLMHAFIPAKYIDHTHADAILVLTNQINGEKITRDALGDDVIILEYKKPGFELAKAAARAFGENPDCKGMVLMKHGLLTWGESARESYERTIELVTKAERYLSKKCRKPLKVKTTTSLSKARERYLKVAPILRGLLAIPTGNADWAYSRFILKPLINKEILNLVDSYKGKVVALTPPLTTDHLIRTKAYPLWIDELNYDDEEKLRGKIKTSVAKYIEKYDKYFERYSKKIKQKINRFDSMSRVILIPGLGAICAGQDVVEADIVKDITFQTLSAKMKIYSMGEYEGLNEKHLFGMEYFSLQHAKLARKDKFPLGSSVAIVSGAAGAIGSGICEELLKNECHVAVSDLPGDNLNSLVDEFKAKYKERVIGVNLDVTNPKSVANGFDKVIESWGGIDLVVVNAGIASVSSLMGMDPNTFRKLEQVNIEGTLNFLSESGRHFRVQGTGGDVVVISTKNVFSPGTKFGAYSATKAAAHQLARIASLEFAEMDVRVNMVSPDAVFSHGKRKSGLWAEVGPDRMRARGLSEKELEEYYKNRNLLKAKVTAEHVAKAVLFFATRQTPTTGSTIPVDGGLPDATPR